jgi:hypothetical protein
MHFRQLKTVYLAFIVKRIKSWKFQILNVGNHKKIYQDIPSGCRDLNPGPPKAGVLTTLPRNLLLFL